MDLLSPRPQPHCGKFEIAVFSLYCALLASVVPFHEPWADEAQSWLLARDLSLGQLFGKYLHYEGSPGTWHLLLWLLIRLHVSYAAMHWVAAAIAAAGVWVFLVYSPFPPILRAVLPFTFYLAYQYAVIARSYVLFPLLVFSAALLFKQCPRRLISFALVLGVLGNLCSQGLLVAAGLALALAVHLWNRRAQLDPADVAPRRLLLAAGIAGALWLFAIVTAWPAPDNSYLPLDQLHTQMVGMLSFMKVTGIDPITSGLSNSILLSGFLLLATLYHLFKSRQIVDFVPYLLLLTFLAYVASRPWHFGMLFVTLIAVLWISWPSDVAEKHTRWASAVLVVALLLVAADQMTWTYRAVSADISGPYSGDREAAEFLKTHAAGKRVAGFHFWSIGILPYFSSNIFFNQPRQSFWFWSMNAHVDDQAVEVVKSRPDYIVVGIGLADPTGKFRGRKERLEAALEISGLYHETERFCGDAFSGHGYSEHLCQAIFVPADMPAANGN